MELSQTYLVQIFVSLVLALSALSIFNIFQQQQEELRERESLLSKKESRKQSPLLNVVRPLITFFSSFCSLLPLEKSRERLKVKLTQAGNPASLSPDEFYATKILSFVVGLLVGWLFDDSLETTPGIMLGLAVLGFVYPVLWLNGEILKRRQRIFRDLPDMLDILRLASEAGLDFNSSMKIVVEKGREGPLLAELEQVEKEIALGRTRMEAFRRFADRIAMTEISGFVIALFQAEQLGASIGPVLKVQSEMARTKRWQLAEALVNKLPMKMLGPLVVFIFPSSFIILFTPLLIQWFQSK
ncbi:MAG: type II secretion system F family protein [Proteobacteria bacterium]|nr:type II secretion system F family protein [Pseudomonadota bacterium]